MKNIKLFESFNLLNEAKNLFGDMDEYKERFKAMEGFAFSKNSEQTSGVPKVFPELDLKDNPSKDGWNYMTLRAYCNENPSSANRNQSAIEFGAKFKDTKELLDFVTSKVMGPNKKEWKATTIRKSAYKSKDNKNDKIIAFQHPALGFIIFNVVDSIFDRRGYRNGVNDGPTYRFQVMAYFMVDKKYVGDISKHDDLDKKTDAMLAGLSKEQIKAVWSYIKQKHGEFSW